MTTGVLSARAAAGLPADFNGDGQVDGDDLAAWRAGFGATGQTNNHTGDADGDGDVDGGDFLAWQRGLINTSAVFGDFENVPEPTGLALISMVAFAVGGSNLHRLLE